MQNAVRPPACHTPSGTLANWLPAPRPFTRRAPPGRSPLLELLLARSHVAVHRLDPALGLGQRPADRPVDYLGPVQGQHDLVTAAGAVPWLPYHNEHSGAPLPCNRVDYTRPECP